MGSGRLTLHAIDTYFGRTKAGLRVELFRIANETRTLVTSVDAVEGGRTADPLIPEGSLEAGRYELLMHVGDYFERANADLPEPSFLNEVPIRFGVADADDNYHLAVLFSPWSYSYYRGN